MLADVCGSYCTPRPIPGFYIPDRWPAVPNLGIYLTPTPAEGYGTASTHKPPAERFRTAAGIR